MSSQVWRRVVLLKYKADACRGAIARAVNIHNSFTRTIPAVLRSSEGPTFTLGRDGGGAYPGEHDVNRGFDSAVEMIVDVDNADDMASRFWDHPAHLAAGKEIEPLIESAARMDWLEDRGTALAGTPAPAQPYVKHVVFFELEAGTTEAQTSALFDGWRGLATQIPSVRRPRPVAIRRHGGVRRGHRRGHRAGIDRRRRGAQRVPHAPGVPGGVEGAAGPREEGLRRDGRGVPPVGLLVASAAAGRESR
jgi:hypothetical protein